MKDSTIQYHREFEWFGVVYTAVLIGGFALLLRAFGANPFNLPIFWGLVLLIVLGQGAYYIAAHTSPDRLLLSEESLVVHWPNRPRELSIPRLEVRIRKSNLFTGSYRISSRHESFYVFPGHEQGKKLVDELLNPEWHLE